MVSGVVGRGLYVWRSEGSGFRGDGAKSQRESSFLGL